MLDIIKDTLIDTLKLLPFLFMAFLIIELLEHKLKNRNKKIITKSKKYGPAIASIIGVIPQCGFSVLATNLYITRIITLGTLISIYLSTSDEMLIILLSEKVSFNIIAEILIIKVLFGMIYGFIIDRIITNKETTKEENFDICKKEHCHCEENLLLSVVKHTLNITLFILISTFIINTLLSYFGEDYLSKLLLKNSFFSPFITSLIGLIPNCGASVILTELYLNDAINMSALIAGLLTGSGTSLLVLFKENKNIKENINIVFLLYTLGVLSGIIIKLIK